MELGPMVILSRDAPRHLCLLKTPSSDFPFGCNIVTLRIAWLPAPASPSWLSLISKALTAMAFWRGTPLFASSPLPAVYDSFLQELKDRIRSAQVRAAL